jgi:hypothetical protein
MSKMVSSAVLTALWIITAVAGSQNYREIYLHYTNSDGEAGVTVFDYDDKGRIGWDAIRARTDFSSDY